jgi:hypothetical protein
VYTGGGIYVAYDWYSAGSPYATTPATYWAESSALVPGCASANSATAAPTTLGTTAFRPNFLFGIPNTFTNEISVNGINAAGRLAGSLTTTNVVTAFIRNGANQTLNNVPVSLNIGGANTFANTQTISSLASGASTTITFPVFTPLNSGLNTVSVSVPSDQNNANNLSTYTQSITCNEWALNPASANYTLGSVGFNTGSGIIAVSYTNPVSSTLTALRFAVSNNTSSIGGQGWAVLLSSTGSVLATTNTLTLTGGMLSTFQTMTFTSSQVLSANTQYYLGFAQNTHTVGYFPAGTYTDAAVPFTNYATFALTGGAPLALGSNLGYLGIEAIFTPINPTITVSSTTVVCGSPATLVANTSGSYTWSAGSANANQIATPTVNTTYTVNVANSFGCLNSTTAAVVVNPITVTAVSATSSICSGATVSLTASGATNYSWSTAQSGGTISVSPTVNTTYNVTGTNSAGCSNTSAVSVTVNTRPTVSIGNFTVCSGSIISLTPTGASTYTYSNGSSTLVANTNTNVSITGTGTNGCVSSNTAVSSIVANPVPTISAVNFTVCSGSIVTLTPVGASTYTFSNGSPTLVANTSTAINITGTGTNGCVSSNTAVSSIVVNPIPIISVNNFTLCSGGTITVTPSGASTYTFSNGSATIAPVTSTQVVIVGISSAGCLSSNAATTTILVNQNPTITVNSGMVCAGSQFAIVPSGASTYTITGGNFTVSPVSTTSYSISGTNSVGCLNNVATISSVSVNPNPTVTATPQFSLMCVGETNTVVANGANTYSWNTGATSTSIAVTLSVAVNQSITLTGTDNNGCSNTTSVTLFVDACVGLKNGEVGNSGIKLFPNPGNGLIHVIFENAFENNVILVHNTLGQIIAESKVTEKDFVLDLSAYKNGIYFVTVLQQSKMIYTAKVIKQ